MFVVVFLIAVVITILVNMFMAWLATVVAPSTGLEVLAGLDFWNWFWVIVLVQFVTWASTSSSARK